ncbi:antiviral reverse transcriptase Drt3b [Flagellimonas zhangzhouensis]|uniref:Reverse transcriptase (RNA-dependent DNA polymerase) n=1 Tax=Flagellimonas zhangzhouensis TaxID=1073328 RepID=A0A1H2XSH1_9FLAO|nr:antiviral reverse transcriptase Drt3b [Allomuricauda zhangzhouensis]SDQ91101.1 Reverse transcriptase (RNA-dependent DNA polymerase) [Allomuricauda zhangzhouensis]SDW95882.1 Reverse transcriptase (RNA-dependent DNA polymerase) [Allomuricauda zhangzhouensis]
MRKGKKIPLSYSIERAVLSDVLPYETPIIFSNRHFYEFLVKYKIKYCAEENQFTWINCKDENIIKEIISIIFDAHGVYEANKKKLNSNELRKIPFHYKIAHKENDFRDLALPHPKCQIELVSFYEEFKELILHYSKQSSFSIRRPASIAKFVYSNTSAGKDGKGDEEDMIEEYNKEYKSLKTFFTYEKYSNVYKFYEDYIYHRAEKKFNRLLKFDLAKCFDSIYTHSLAWTLFDKQFVKDNLDKIPSTFPGKFDAFISGANYGETNGILIGPEFSRIFAELILQGIDKKVESDLSRKKKIHKIDYEIYRYVDDYFLFYNEEETKEIILETYKVSLKEYKMSFNDSKTIPYEKPLITEITIAKNKILNLVRENIEFKIRKEKDKEDKSFPNNVPNQDDLKPEKKIKVGDVKIRCNSNKLITEFKTIVVVSHVSYKDIMNFTLAVFKTVLTRNIKKYQKHKRAMLKRQLSGNLSEKEKRKLAKQESNFTEYTIEMLDFIFFLYGVSPRVNSTIKLVGMLSIIIKTFKKKTKVKSDEARYSLYYQFFQINQEKIFKKISDEIILTLDRNKLREHVQIETLYLLIILKELGKDYRLTANQLIKYLNLDEILDSDNKSYDPKRYKFKNEINYFVITVLLFYLKDIKEYRGLKVVIKESIRKKIGAIKKGQRTKYSELVLLFFDLIACPYLKENDNKFKKEILTCFGVDKANHQEFINFVERQRYWFTKWDNFNLLEELNAKSSLEPYS